MDRTSNGTRAERGTRTGLFQRFQHEYSGAQSVRRYSSATAGAGINYLLDHEYGPLYLRVIQNCIRPELIRDGIRIWEFGCGAGMNLLHLVRILERHDVKVVDALGTDFSAVLLESARQDVDLRLSAETRSKVRFAIARNERLADDAAESLATTSESLQGSFHFILGVNTMRYGHRLGNADTCAEEICRVLMPGGVCVAIDMNRHFPAFRSRLRDALTKEERERHLPSLDEYARPFVNAGFEILEKRNFCWIPHSAGPALLRVMRTLGPILHAVAPACAMRSLIVARKPSEESLRETQ